jgi:hypothetical protein
MSKSVDQIIAMLENQHSSFHAVDDTCIKGNGIKIEDLGNVVPYILPFTSIAKVFYKNTKVNTTLGDLVKLEKAARKWFRNADLSRYG